MGGARTLLYNTAILKVFATCFPPTGCQERGDPRFPPKSNSNTQAWLAVQMHKMHGRSNRASLPILRVCDADLILWLLANRRFFPLSENGLKVSDPGGSGRKSPISHT